MSDESEEGFTGGFFKNEGARLDAAMAIQVRRTDLEEEPSV